MALVENSNISCLVLPVLIRMELSNFTQLIHLTGIYVMGKFSMRRSPSKGSVIYLLGSSASSTMPSTQQVHNNRTDLEGIRRTSRHVKAGPKMIQGAELKEARSSSQDRGQSPGLPTDAAVPPKFSDIAPLGLPKEPTQKR